jgi:MarR family 2-MHQ and catechol resistance regulon transcriptional repressor
MESTRRYGKKTDLALGTWVKLARAFTVLSHRSAEQIRTFGLTEAQFAALECLGHKGSLTPGELCRKQLVSGGNMTVVLDNLEKEGLIERVRSLEDRRSMMINLTPKGQKLFDRIFVLHAAHIEKLVSVLTVEEQVQMSTLLKKLGLALQERA